MGAKIKAEEIFGASVTAMKKIISSTEMIASIQRAKKRTEEENRQLLIQERMNINEAVRKIAYGHDSELLQSASRELIDAVVLRYLRNRDIFMKTFPEGIEHIIPDPLMLWAAIMISPQDDNPVL